MFCSNVLMGNKNDLFLLTSPVRWWWRVQPAGPGWSCSCGWRDCRWRAGPKGWLGVCRDAAGRWGPLFPSRWPEWSPEQCQRTGTAGQQQMCSSEQTQEEVTCYKVRSPCLLRTACLSREQLQLKSLISWQGLMGKCGLVYTAADICLNKYFSLSFPKSFLCPHNLWFTKYLCLDENTKITTNAQASTPDQ